ncbi:MAG: carboxypeptidase-like regulatory domain-containing protein [Parcubacteria group bacterium]|jgi:hypothetical protein
MEKLKRTIFFWTLVVLFLIITPIIVLNAWGYRFDLRNGVFVHSGSITIKANPQEFDVHIDGNLESAKQLSRINNSYNITGLTPKSYGVTVSADGFQSWRKNLEVHSGISTELWNVLLVRQDYPRTPYAAAGAEKFFVSPKNDQVIYVGMDNGETVAKILNINDKSLANTFIFPDWKFIDDTRKENIEWSPQGDFLSIPLQKTVVPTMTPLKKTLTKNAATTQAAAEQTQYAYFIADPNANTTFNLNDLLGKDDLRNVRWDPQDKNYLFFLSENSLYRANITDKADLTLIADQVSSYDLSQNNVYYSQMPTELIFRTNLDGKSGLTQITNAFPEQLNSANEKLIVFDDMRIAFLNTNGNLYIFNRGELDTYFKKLGGSVAGMQFSNDGKKLLFWTDHEISAYFLRQWSVQPTRNENETQDITRYSDRLKNVQWFADYEHVLFSTGPYVKIIELDSRDHRISMDVLKTDTDSPFVIYNDSLERLFLTDIKDNVSDIFSIVFPEPGAFLGIFPPAQQ